MYKNCIKLVVLLAACQGTVFGMESLFEKARGMGDKASSYCHKLAGWPLNMVPKDVCDQLGMGKDKIAHIEDAYKALTKQQKNEAKAVVQKITGLPQFTIGAPDIVCKYDPASKARMCSIPEDQWDRTMRAIAPINVELAVQFDDCLKDEKRTVNTCVALSLYTVSKLDKKWHKQQIR